MAQVQTITPFLWFDSEAEDAAKFYTGIFKNFRMGSTTRYSEAGKDQHHRPPGSVMTVQFDLEGQSFTAPKAQQCGWLKDKFGLSWQVVPDVMIELLKDPANAVRRSTAVAHAV